MRIAKTLAVITIATVTVTACSSATPTGPANPGAVVQAIASAESAAPTLESTPDPDSDDAVTTEAQTGPPVAAGSMMPGTDLPIPQGIDCSGSNTAKDAKGNLFCGGDVTDPTAYYNYFLLALPKAGFTIGSTAYQKEDNGLSAAIYFNGGKFAGIDAITFADDEVDITLQVT